MCRDVLFEVDDGLLRVTESLFRENRRTMTVTYNSDVNTAGFMTFVRLFFRWKGSLWKAVYKELILWLFFYGILALTYKLLLSEPKKRIFESIAVFFAKYTDFIPLTFMLGFFVSLVVQRWLSMASNLGYIDYLALHVCAYIKGNDERGIMLRRTILRYALFFQALAYRTMSEVILNRFPNLENFVAAGYISADELQIFEDIKENNSRMTQLWIPLKWAFDTVIIARDENRITDHGVQDIYSKFVDFRKALGTLLTFDWIPIPLLYTQVVCLTVRLYFIICLMGRQNLENAPDKEYVDDFNLHVPLMTIFQFVFYMGWMKVAEALLNPLGDDDDDFELNFLLDRNMQVAFAMAGNTPRPDLVRDAFWDESLATPMYSLQTVNAVVNPMIGSALLHAQQQGRPLNSKVNTDVVMVPRDSIAVDDDDRRSSIASFHSGVFEAVKRKLSRMTGSVYPDSEESGIRKRRRSSAVSISSPQETIHKDQLKHDLESTLDSIAKPQHESGIKSKPASARTISDLPAVAEEDEQNGSHKSLQQMQPKGSQQSIYSVESCSIVFSDSARSSFSPTRQPDINGVNVHREHAPSDESKEHIH
ncbi:hypothetical protein QR680_000739 [Steinernema hermaphroditum]|uniref:Bestrophin homolog n=1 Tax=Steinernema hermaphroditum TaxID=289476 RepID=A0AA39LEM0_9BILA|nr:hypothetical protein QR680_000739 [Steinernema hermaphroditum]